MGKLVIYTAIFGEYDGLIPQPKYKGVDYLCFSDRPRNARPWNVIEVEPRFEDPTRNARYHKILPHRVLPNQYDQSIWIDGNYLIRNKAADFAREKLEEKPMWVFDHNQCKQDARNCVYQEYEALVAWANNEGVSKDQQHIMQRQIERYRQEGYPENNGLVFSAVLLRNHTVSSIVETMELWWKEVANGSKRDQLSFDYAVWKTGLNIGVLEGDLRRHSHFYRMGKHRDNYTKKIFLYKVKSLLGLV
jgi:hypothetical protein